MGLSEQEELELLELEAEAARARVAPPGPPGLLEGAARGVAQGASLGFADELTGLVESLFSDKTYQQARDESRQAYQSAQKAHPYVYGGGELAGGVGSAIATAGVGTGLRGAALLGAGAGLGQSAADLTKGQVGGALVDAATGAALGSGAYGAGKYIAAPLLKRAAPSARQWARGVAVDKGRNALLNGADQQSKRAPVSEEAVLEAIDSGAVRPLGSTAGAARRLGKLSDETGEAYGAVLDALEERGVKGASAWQLFKQLQSMANKERLQTLNQAIPAEYEARAAQLLDIGGGPTAPAGSAMGFRQTENLKRSMQDMARYGRVEDTPLNDTRKAIASAIRQANEDAVAKAGETMGGEVRQLSESFVPLKRKLGRLLEAQAASERGAARASQRVTDPLSSALDAASHGVGAPDAALIAALIGALKSLYRGRGASTMAAGARAFERSDLMSRAPNWAGDAAASLLRSVQDRDDIEQARRNYVDNMIERLKAERAGVGGE